MSLEERKGPRYPINDNEYSDEETKSKPVGVQATGKCSHAENEGTWMRQAATDSAQQRQTNSGSS